MLPLTGTAAQNQNGEKPEEQEVEETRRKFIRIGIDPTRYALTYLQKADRGGMEATIDYEIFNRFYSVFDAGYMFASKKESDFNFTANGIYGRIGFDYNLLKPIDNRDHNAFFFGLRLASSYFQQETTNITYQNRFGTMHSQVPSENANALWTEFTMGVKVEAFKNFFVGWTGRGKMLLNQSNPVMEPYIIPGYGRINANGNYTADMNIYILYAFSL